MKFLDWIILLIMAGILVIASITAIKINSDAGRCLKEPIQFGIDGLAKANEGKVYCSCGLLKLNANVEPMMFYSQDL